jgi:hypothetical protein
MVAIQGETVSPGNQTLTVTTSNNDQNVSSGNAIVNIVFTWGGDATDASVTGLPNGIIATKNSTAKTLTLSGTPTETMSYTVTTAGSIGSAVSISGTITVLPPSSQVLTSTSNNNSQTIVSGNAITSIVFTWSGDATDANVSGLASGLSAAKDAVAKTITISGTPTATGATTYTVATSGSAGTSVSVSGTITVNAASVGDQIHNFTLSGTTNAFYTINGALSTSKGTVSYDGLTLTQCLKIESSTSVAYTTTQASTLTLVFVETAPTIKFDGVNYTGSGGIITLSVAAGSHTFLKNNVANLFYIKTSYPTLGLGDNVQASKLVVYPNPVSNQLYISSEDQKVKNVTIYSLSGAVVKNVSNNTESVDVSDLASGNYVVRVVTENGITTKKIIKK